MNLKHTAVLILVSSALQTTPQQSTVYAQNRLLQVITLNDSTSAIDLPTYHMRIVFPKGDDVLPKPNYSITDGIADYLLGIYNGSSLSVEIANFNAIKIAYDSANARIERHEGEDEGFPLETPQDFIHRRVLLRGRVEKDFFQSYSLSHYQAYGIKSYFSEPIGYITEAHTAFNEFQVLFRVIGRDMELNSKISSLLAKITLKKI